MLKITYMKQTFDTIIYSYYIHILYGLYTFFQLLHLYILSTISRVYWIVLKLGKLFIRDRECRYYGITMVYVCIKPCSRLPLTSLMHICMLALMS